MTDYPTCRRCGVSIARGAADHCSTCGQTPRRPWTDLSWMDRGSCAQIGPHLFFREDGPGTSAKAICNGDDRMPACPVRDQCLAYALEHGETGVWGGTSAQERAAIRREQREAAA